MAITINSLGSFVVDGTPFASLATAFPTVASPTLLQNALLTYEAGLLAKITQANQRVSEIRAAHTSGSMGAINTVIAAMEATANQERIAVLNAEIAKAQAEIATLS